MMTFLFDRLEIIVGKGEIACYKHFLLYLLCFKIISRSGLLKAAFNSCQIKTTVCDQTWKRKSSESPERSVDLVILLNLTILAFVCVFDPGCALNF